MYGNYVRVMHSLDHIAGSLTLNAHFRTSILSHTIETQIYHIPLKSGIKGEGISGGGGKIKFHTRGNVLH